MATAAGELRADAARSRRPPLVFPPASIRPAALLGNAV